MYRRQYNYYTFMTRSRLRSKTTITMCYRYGVWIFLRIYQSRVSTAVAPVGQRCTSWTGAKRVLKVEAGERHLPRILLKKVALQNPGSKVCWEFVHLSTSTQVSLGVSWKASRSFTSTKSERDSFSEREREKLYEISPSRSTAWP